MTDNPPVGRRPRLADVARRAGVAKSIASRVLSGAEVTVRAETRERVEAAARELGYHAHPAARALNNSQSRSIGMLIPSMTNVVYSRIVRGAVQRAFDHEFAIFTAEDTEEQADSIQRLVRAHLLDGLIVASARPHHPLLPFLRSSGIPHVFALRGVTGSGRNVLIDDDRAARLAVEHLASAGHVRLGHVGGPRDVDSARRRARGFAKAASELELTAATERAEYSERGGARATRALLAAHEDVTAIFAASLPQAVGVLYTANELGIAIPDQLAVISYDDMPLAEFLCPAVTTIRVPLEELGAAAFEALYRQIDGDEPADIVVDSAPQVIARKSTERGK